MSSKRLKHIEAPGQLIQVNDTEMHVYSIPCHLNSVKGTIVFLSGSGTECPTYDFKPLWYLLQGKYNIAIVERPGYGWSGQTKHPRDIDTILEETREALRGAGIVAPFVPMAHSLSGLEAIYWAQKYPDEVCAIIGLDMAVPQVYDDMERPKGIGLIAKLAHLLSVPIARARMKSHPAVKENLLDEREQMAMRYIISKQILSKNMIDEIDFVKQNASKVAGGICPSISTLCYIANDKEILKSTPKWGKAHRKYFAANELAQVIDLQCGHYIHLEVPEIVAESMKTLFSKL